MENKKEKQLEKVLLEKQLITTIQLKVIRDYRKSVGGTLKDIIVKLGFSTQEKIEEALTENNKIVVSSEMVDHESISKLPEKLLRGYKIIPVKTENGTVIAAENGLEPLICEELWNLLGKQYSVVPAEPGTVIKTLDVLFLSEPPKKTHTVILPKLTVKDICSILLMKKIINADDLVFYAAKKAKEKCS